MSNICQLTGKRPGIGNNVSHSNRKTNRRYLPNLTTKKIIDPTSGKQIKVKMSIRAQRTLLKNPAKFKTQLKKLVAKKRG